MDFLRRDANGQPQAAKANTGSQSQTPAAASSADGKFKKAFSGSEPRWLRVIIVVLLFSLTILAVAIAMLFYFGKSKEASLVDESKVQAVFLTNGQVYFGKIKEVNGKYFDLQNIYYLNSQQQPEAAAKTNTQTNFSLVKLGCELHGPLDQMIISRDQISFWENLTTDGKVAKAIDQWVQQNPNGQDCNAAANTTQPNGATNKQ